MITGNAIVGVLGVGRMGRAVVHNLLKGGYRVCGYDPVFSEENKPFSELQLCTSEADLASRSDFILVILGFDEEVRDIVLADDFRSGLKPGSIVGIMSTVLPGTLLTIREGLPEGVALLDLPVCRGQKAADEGRLLCLVGGNHQDLDKVSAVLSSFCADIEHVGDVGSGQVAKMANNVMLWSSYFGVFDGLRLMAESGVSLEHGTEALLGSSAQSWALKMWPDVRPVWAADDLRIAIHFARSKGLEVPVLEAVAAAFAKWPNPEADFVSTYSSNGDR